MDQTLTDVNTEFSEYRLFVCPKETKFVHADIQSASFDGRCPSDGSELMPVEKVPPDKCPRCGQALVVDSVKPLTSDSGSAE